MYQNGLDDNNAIPIGVIGRYACLRTTTGTYVATNPSTTATQTPILAEREIRIRPDIRLRKRPVHA